MSLKPRRAHTLQRGKVCKTRQTFPLDSPVRVVSWGLEPYICARIKSHHPSTQSPSRARLQGWPHGQQRALTGKRNKEKGIYIKDFFRSAYVRGLCPASFPNLGASVLLPVALCSTKLLSALWLMLLFSAYCSSVNIASTCYC